MDKSIKDIIIEKNKAIKETLKWTLSVSKCNSYLETPFDNIAIATNCFNKGYDDPNYKYYHMTVEEIVDLWKKTGEESTKYGRLLDDYIGMNLNAQNDILDVWKLDYNYDYDERLKGLCDGFDQFYAELTGKSDYKYVMREQQMFIFSSSGNAINGRFDCLFYSETRDRYMLIDWKSSKDIETKAGFGNKKLKGPCFNLDECNGNTYTIQLQMYKKAMCETYGITTPDKVDIFICRMLTTADENRRHYKLYPQNFQYDSELLDKIIDFGYRKYEVENKNNII